MASRSQDPQAVAERLRTALDLAVTGEDLVRQRLRRENAGITAEELENRLAQWFLTRPGAEGGDAVGRQVTWPRSHRP